MVFELEGAAASRQAAVTLKVLEAALEACPAIAIQLYLILISVPSLDKGMILLARPFALN